MADTTEKVRVGDRPTIRPAVAGGVIAIALGVGLTYFVARSVALSIEQQPSPSLDYRVQPECILRYNNAGWGPELDLYMQCGDTKYFRQIDGKDISGLVR